MILTCRHRVLEKPCNICFCCCCNSLSCVWLRGLMFSGNIHAHTAVHVYVCVFAYPSLSHSPSVSWQYKHFSCKWDTISESLEFLLLWLWYNNLLLKWWLYLQGKYLERESILEISAPFISSSEAMLIVFLDFMNLSLWIPCPSSKGEEDKF